jgi:hypothetical protein
MWRWIIVFVAVSGILAGRMLSTNAHDSEASSACSAADLGLTTGYLARPTSFPGDFVRPGAGEFAVSTVLCRDVFAAPTGLVGEAGSVAPSRSLQQQRVRWQV